MRAAATTPPSVSAEFARGSAWVDGPGTVTQAEIGIAGAGSVRSGRGIELHLSDVAVRDNGIGVFADRLRLTGVTAQGNRDGIASNYRIRGDDVLANDNAQFGVWSAAGAIRLRRLTASDNGWYGVIATQGGRVVLVDSTVTDNAPAYGAIDVASSRRPSLTRVACGRSSDSYGVFFTGGTSWGVCAGD